MPYPNEHACRLKPPNYDRYARKNCEQKSDGKCIDVIYGVKEGASEVQALRYPKDIWSAEAARSHCDGRGGTFEAAAEEDSVVAGVTRARETRLQVVGEFRMENDEKRLTGYMAKFDIWSEPLGWFKERIRRGAFQKTLKDGADVRCTFNHKPEYILGRRSAGTLEVAEDEVGLPFQCAMPDTSYARDLRVSIERGDISQCSFTFDTIKDKWSEDHKERDLLEVRLYEGGPVTFPAYLATEVSLRAAFACDGIRLSDVLEIITMKEHEEVLSRADKKLLEKAIGTLQRFAPEDEPGQAAHSDSAASKDEPGQAAHSATQLNAVTMRRRLEQYEHDYQWEGEPHGN